MNTKTKAATAIALIGLTAGTASATMSGTASAAGTCRYTVNSLTPLDLQEGGNGDEINVILNGQTFGPFKFSAPSGAPASISNVDKVFTDQIKVKVSEDDFTFNDVIGKPLTFACQAGSDTVDFQDGSAHYQLRYTITQL